MAKLTDKQRKQIIAEYVEGDGKVSQRDLARKFSVSQVTISKILTDKSVKEKLSEAKNDNLISMCEYIKAKSERVQHLIDIALETSDQQMREASLRDKMGAVKILIEKFFPPEDEREEDLPSPITIVVKETREDE